MAIQTTTSIPAATIRDRSVATPRVWNGVNWVIAFAALAIFPIALLHVTAAAVVHPLLDPISYYALVPGDYPLMLLGCALLAGSGGCLAVWLAWSGLPGVRLPVGLLISFAVAFLLVGIFPTDPLHAEVSSLSATIHRIGAGWGVAVVPIVGALVGRSLVGSALTPYPARLIRLARWVAGVMIVFFSIHLPLAIMGSRIPAFGLLERAGFALVIAFFILLAVTIRREGYREVQERAAAPALRQAQAA